MNPDVDPGLPNIAEEWATPEETRGAIDSFGPTEFAKLSLISRAFARQRLRDDVIEPRDLLHDAVVKTLDGRRRWKKGISIIKHLDRVMESDSGHAAEQRKTGRTESLSYTSKAFTQSDQDRHLANSEDANALFNIFADDENAGQVIRLKADGLKASDIQSALGLSKTQYESVLKRIRRRLVKYLLSKEETSYGTKL